MFNYVFIETLTSFSEWYFKLGLGLSSGSWVRGVEVG